MFEIGDYDSNTFRLDEILGPLIVKTTQKTDWDLRFLELAKYISGWSKDPTKVGAVIAKGKRLISVGFNGFPPGIKDDERLLDRPAKIAIIQHAESNAIRWASGNDLSKCSLYTWPMPPCASCSGDIISYGIKRVVTVKNENPRWVESIQLSKELFKEANVEYIERII